LEKLFLKRFKRAVIFLSNHLGTPSERYW